MKPVSQLLRDPARTGIACLLLCASFCFLFFGFGVNRAMRESIDQVQRQFVTIALPSTEKALLPYENGSGQKGTTIEQVFTEDDWVTADKLAQDNTVVEGVYQQKYISAISENLVPLVSASEGGRYSSNLDYPANQAALIIAVTEVKESQFSWEIVGSVDQCVSLHPAYEIRSTIHISIPSDYSPLPEVGNHYLIIGTYRDWDLQLRQVLAVRLRCPIEEISWSNLSSDGIQQMKEDAIQHGYLEGIEDIAAEYFSESTGRSVTLNQSDLDKVNSASVSLLYITDTKTGVTSPAITEIDEELSTFLDQEENLTWKYTIESTEMNLHCFPIMGTDRLECVCAFNQKWANIVEGRAFLQEEYQSGTKVCLISETLALQNGIHLGDTLPLFFYGTGDPIYVETSSGMTRPVAQALRTTVPPKADIDSFQVIGIYRQTDIWGDGYYQITPNTIIVPNKSLPEYAGLPRNGNFVTFALQSNKVQEFKEAASALGLDPARFVVFDSEIEDLTVALEDSVASGHRLLASSIIAWIITISAYFLAVSIRQRKNLGLMRAQGASKRDVIVFFLITSVLPVVFSSVVGAILCSSLFKFFISRLTGAIPAQLLAAFNTAFAMGFEEDGFMLGFLSEEIPVAVSGAVLCSVTAFAVSLAISNKSPTSLLKGD